MKVLLALALSLGIAAAETKLGKPLTLKQATPIATVSANPDQFVGKVVQVRGKVSEVCEAMGCWMILVDDSGAKAVRIKVNDGEITFPKTAVGKIAAAEGKFVRIALSKEQAIAQKKHEAEENGKNFDPAGIKGPVTIYQIQGTGAVILD